MCEILHMQSLHKFDHWMEECSFSMWLLILIVSCIQADSLHTHAHVYIVFKKLNTLSHLQLLNILKGVDVAPYINLNKLKYTFTPSVMKYTEGSRCCPLYKLEERNTGLVLHFDCQSCSAFCLRHRAPMCYGAHSASYLMDVDVTLVEGKDKLKLFSNSPYSIEVWLKHRGNLTVICKIWAVHWGESEQ